MSNKNILITGGCRSGKSRHALTLGNKFPGKKIYLATAEPLDEEMQSRIARHREERREYWVTIEEPINLISVLKAEGDEADVILLDCLTLWISNLLMKGDDSKNILKRIEKFKEECCRAKSTIIIVTNEVGDGIVPDNKLARVFRDIVGEANQMIAGQFDQVVQVVSGIPVIIKGSPEQNNGAETAGQHEFSSIKKQGLYEAIYKRRDVRHFNSKPVDPAVLGRVLKAAHHAGSVGYMQPWNFMVIDDPAVKQEVKTIFEHSNRQAARKFEGKRRKIYDSLKLEGITDAPLNICVTCDGSRFGPNVLGRDTIPETDILSACCAVQNLWLAARAEGLGVGWVSILSLKELKRILKIPEDVQPVAYLCVGYTDKFPEKPMLETVGWGERLNLANLIYYNTWQGSATGFTVKLPRDL